MSGMSELATNLATENCGSELLPLSPFNSLNYHFGMLLGVADFETEQAYHRAKMRLHNAWLHREGVVWGFGVAVDDDRGEIRVKPGLALDAAGHELHLDAEYCLNVGEWFAKHEKDPGFNLVPGGFAAHVVICFKACLNRQVPALLEPCDNGSTSTAYSRVSETVEIRLLPGRAPERVYPYRRLRLLFGLAAPQKLAEPKLDELNGSETLPSEKPEGKAPVAAGESDQAVLDEVKRIQALAAELQPSEWLQAFHRFAALDEIDLKPATSKDGARTLLFPGQEDDCVVLADITDLALTKKDNRWVLSGGKVDSSVRPSHVATTTIQDLLCGSLIARASAAEESEEEDTKDGDDLPLGPRVDPKLVAIENAQIVLQFDKPLQPASVKPEAFSVSIFAPEKGWQIFTINVAVDSLGKTVTLKPKPRQPPFGAGRLRIVALGTGAAPLVGENFLPLAGATTGKPVPTGSDFVLMRERE